MLRSSRTTIANTLTVLLLFLVGTNAASEVNDYFKITVVDEETGRGVPLVELKTTSRVRSYTDSNGIVAFYEPGLMDQVRSTSKVQTCQR